jgi:hypothetical protein
MNVSTRFAASALALALASSPSAYAITLGMLDTFEDDTTAAWSDGPLNPLPAAVVSSGGPQGGSDAYLVVTSSGIPGPGGKLVAMNAAQWSGDYIEAGVTVIRMHVNNLGATDLSLRLLIEGPSILRAFSTAPVALPAGSGWRQVELPVTAAALTGPSAGAVLADVVQLRLYHGVATVYPGEDVLAQLGIDNITAVPEPGAWALLGVGLAVVLMRVQRRKER